jgi:hypothetical protein
MFIGLSGPHGKGISVESPEEKRDYTILFGQQNLTIGIAGVVVVAAISTFYSPDDSGFGFVMGGAFLLYALLGLWHLVAGFQMKGNNSSPIPDHELIRITDFIKDNGALDVLEGHIQTYRSLKWDNLHALSVNVRLKMEQVHTQRKNEETQEARRLTGIEAGMGKVK